MEFNDYQNKARSTAMYPKDQGLVYCTLGLTGESGEVSDKVKKLIRDKGGECSQTDREDLAKELGDVLWYIANLSFELGFDLESIAASNLNKLSSRSQRGVLGGEGDDR